MVTEHHLSERRACRLVGLSRDSYRSPPEPDQGTVELSGKIIEIAQVRRRFGYLFDGTIVSDPSAPATGGFGTLQNLTSET